MSRLLKDTMVYGLGGMLNRAIGFLLIPLYTSYLTVSEYGVLAILGVMLQLILFVGLLGVGSAALRYYHEMGTTTDEQSQIYGNAFFLLTVWPLILFSLLTVMIFLLPIDTIAGIETYPLIFMTLIVGFCTPAINLLTGLFRARRQPGYFVMFNTAFFILQALVIIFFVAKKEMGVTGQVAGQVIASFTMFCVATYGLYKFCSIRIDRRVLIRLLKFGVPLLPFFVFAWINTATGRFVIQGQLDLQSVGIFFMAAQFGGILGLVNTALNNSFTPHFYSEACAKNASETLGLFVFRYIVGFSYLALLLLATLPHVVRIIATGEYLEANQFVAGLILANLLYALTSPIHWSLTFSKRTLVLSNVRIIATSALLVLFGLLIWQDAVSIKSIVVSIVVGNLVMLVLGAYCAQQHFRLVIDKQRLALVLILFAFAGILINFVTLNTSWTVALPISVILLVSTGLIGMNLTKLHLSIPRFFSDA